MSEGTARTPEYYGGEVLSYQGASELTTESLDLRFHWHPSVHEVWGGERLYFWRLKFQPTYDREKILAALRRAMDVHNVVAYAVYELYGGGWDILLRIWLPVTPGAFESELRREFPEYSLAAEPFAVTKIVSHWAWSGKGNGEIPELAHTSLIDRLPDADIRQINTGHVDLRTFQDYETQHLLAHTPHTTGIRFFVVIEARQLTRAHHAIERLERGLLGILSQAGHVLQKSAYAGLGFGEYLLMGRVDYEDFQFISKEITEPINDAVDPATYGARTTTCVMSTEDVLEFREELRLSRGKPTIKAVHEYLIEDESQILEVKATAFVNLDRWIHEGGKPVRDDRIIDGGVLRAITGLLNATGGTVVVGAVETKRYSDVDRLREFPRYGQYICVGVELDYPRGDWDSFQTTLLQLMEERITPNPNAFVTLAKEEVEGRAMCVVSVRPANRRGSMAVKWFYHHPRKDDIPKFWVRQGNRTIELVGPEADYYKDQQEQ